MEKRGTSSSRGNVGMWDASPSQIRKEALKLGDAREGKLTLLLVGLIIATSRTIGHYFLDR